MGCHSALYRFVCFFLCVAAFPAESAEEEVKTNKNSTDRAAYFAVVGGQTIPVEEFQAAFRKGVREKFYHGKVSRAEVDSFRKEVAQRLVNKTLLVQEARRRKIEIDNALVIEKIADVDKRNSKSPEWAKSRDRVLQILKERLEGDALVKKLEARVRDVKPPDSTQLQKYYASNAEKFTAPQQWHVGLILLKVDASSLSDVWSAAADEASSLVERIRAGADFSDLARIHSGDESAENGGDMGYLHIGMLAKPAQNVLNLMTPGEISEPVVLLKGVAIFKLIALKKARLNPLKKVEQRARDLWVRGQGGKVWGELLQKLRATTKIEYSEEMSEFSEKSKG